MAGPCRPSTDERSDRQLNESRQVLNVSTESIYWKYLLKVSTESQQYSFLLYFLLIYWRNPQYLLTVSFESIFWKYLLKLSTESIYWKSLSTESFSKYWKCLTYTESLKNISTAVKLEHATQYRLDLTVCQTLLSRSPVISIRK